MKYSKKSRLIILFSGILLGAVILGALFLGAGVGVGKGVGKDTPPNLYIGTEKEETKVALRGTYDLAEISKYKTPYLGHHTKVLSLVSWLPVPDNYFKQQFISMETKQKPYGLTIFYEPASASGYEGGQPKVAPDTVNELNALVVFCMIDNLDEVTFLSHWNFCTEVTPC